MKAIRRTVRQCAKYRKVKKEWERIKRELDERAFSSAQEMEIPTKTQGFMMNMMDKKEKRTILRNFREYTVRKSHEGNLEDGPKELRRKWLQTARD